MYLKLSVIIPVLNEERTVESVLEKLLKLNLGKTKKEIIVVNDGSSDKTESILHKYLSKGIKVYSHKFSQGKGAAVKTGLNHATGDYVLIQDGDQEYDPKYIPFLIDPALKDSRKVIYGTRLNRLPHVSKEEKTFRFFLHYLGNRFLSFLTSVLYGHWITDMETGYKLIPRKILIDLRLESKGFELEPEITAKLLRKNISILEIPITTIPRDYKMGKKLNTFKDGFIAFWTLIKYRFV